MMKTLKYLFLTIIPFLAFYSCTSDDADNPDFTNDELPRIFFTSWQEYTSAKVGDVLTYAPNVSPSDGATYKWTLDGEVISTEKDLSYAITEEFAGVLQFEVTRYDQVNTRTTNILVPKKFSPKESKKKSIAFLTKDGRMSDVDWENITHLVLSSVVVKGDGTLEIPDTEPWNMTNLLAYAHSYGVYVMLEVSGILNSYVNAVPTYGSFTFYDNAIGSNYQTLANAIINEAKNMGVDGINIYMDKATDAAFGDPDGLVRFYTYLGEQFKSEKNVIEEKEYDYILSMSVAGGWTRGALAPCVNIPTYDWVNVLAFTAEDLSPTAHSAQWFAEQEVNYWLLKKSEESEELVEFVNKSRVVLAVPAFGIEYTGKPVDYGWDNLYLYTKYIPYKTICEAHPGAAGKSMITLIDNGGDNTKPVDVIYYDGLGSIKSKAEFVLSTDIAGMALWSIENDSKNEGESLVEQMNKSLNN